MIVVDTNVMVRLVLGGPNGADSAALLKQYPEWASPLILMSELRNALVGYVRRGELSSDEAKTMIDDAASILGGRLMPVASADVIDVALECRLTAYDAEFVALARMLGVRLVTLDGAILRGAADVAVSLTSAGGPAAGPQGRRS